MNRKKTRREENAAKNEDDLFVDADLELKKKVEDNPCKNGCNCLSILESAPLRGAVTRYTVAVDKKSKYEKDTLLMEWYRYSKQSPDEDGRLWYYLPHDATDLIHTEEEFHLLKSHQICSDAMLAVMGVTRKRMTPIIKAFNLAGVPKQHGNKGRSNQIKEDDPRMPPIREHFSILLTLGEVQPTKFIYTGVDDCTTREARNDDPEDDFVYLPQSDGIRPCYYRYM